MLEMAILEYTQAEFKAIAEVSSRVGDLQKHILDIKKALVYLHSPDYSKEYPEHDSKVKLLLINRYTYMFKCLLAARDGQRHS